MTVPLSKHLIIFLWGRQYQPTVSQETTYVHLRSFKSRCQYYIKQARELGAERDASERWRGRNIRRKGHPSDCNAGLIPMTGEGKEADLCRKRLWVQRSHEKALAGSVMNPWAQRACWSNPACCGACLVPSHSLGAPHKSRGIHGGGSRVNDALYHGLFFRRCQ